MTLAPEAPARRDPNVNRLIVPESRFAALGKFNGQAYATYQGREYIVDQGSTQAPSSDELAEGELYVQVKRVQDFDGSKMETIEYHRAHPVPVGWYDRQVAQQEGQKAKVAEGRQPRPVDTLASAVPLTRTPQNIVDMGNFGALLPGRPAVRGPGAIVEAAQRAGYRLTLTPGGRLLVEGSGGRASTHWLDTIRTAERLLVGVLTGHPVLCELPHTAAAPEAWTIVAVGVAACQAHAEGTV